VNRLKYDHLCRNQGENITNVLVLVLNRNFIAASAEHVLGIEDVFQTVKAGGMNRIDGEFLTFVKPKSVRENSLVSSGL